MIIQVDENTAIEVYFDPADREEGFDDETRFRIYESGPESHKPTARQGWRSSGEDQTNPIDRI